MAEYKGVMVFGETVEGKLSPVTAEMLGAGKRLAKGLGQELCAILVGSDVAGFAQETVALGADKAYVVNDPLLKDYQTDAYVTVMEKVVKEVMPRILLLGQTTIGRDLAPRLAFRLNTAVSMDCIDLAIDPGSKLLLQTRPVYGGNAQAVFTTELYPQMATVRAKAMSASERDASRQGQIINIEAGLSPSAVRTRIIQKVTEKVEGIKLEEAEVIVAGGRGIGDANGFKQLEEVAKLLHGAVGATRPPCDNKWVPDSWQIGLTGKIVSPNLYIAVALSGASQHMSGCSGAKNIVAINKDPEANIFKEARFGIVGDWKKVLPAFTQKVKELLAV